jgi:Domain of unknown function (DUF6777)
MTRGVGIFSLLAVALVALAACGGNSAAPTTTSAPKLQTVRFQAPDERGSNPFTPSVDVEGRRTVGVSDDASEQPFGGSGSNHVCDRDKLIRFLASHQGRMLVWASVLHISPSLAAAKRYIAKLHPVTLTRDTQVTNHGFTEAQGAIAFQAILQAGTSVLVDRFGRPVVRCFCGNPLGPAVFVKTSKCVNCPPHYSPPRQCQYGAGDDYDALYYRRSYYANSSYDEVFIRLQRDSRYSGCYSAYPDPPTVTAVAVYRPPPSQQAPQSTSTPQTGLHCNPPRSQLEFEQCNGSGQQTPSQQTPSQQTPSQQTPSQPQTPPTSEEPPPNLPQIGECNNGVDDDGDGAVDMADPGCSSPNDQSE